MSINVTVSGNPVRIKKGKMVTSYDPTKSEFEKRRLMRLEQVRQQSKGIAENIRNKLKKEKANCLSQIEEEGEIKLQKWQARKLLELQNQYQEALEEIGVGHRQAIDVENEEESYVEIQESNEKAAKERGQAAAARLQIERNEESLRKAVPIQRKKLTRDIENTRSTAVATLKKGKSPKKKKRQQLFDSDSENRVPLFNLKDLESISCTCSEADEPRESSRRKTNKEQQTSQTHFQVPKIDKAAQTHLPEETDVNREIPLDTRISEHIKRRTRLNLGPDFCDSVEKEMPLRTFNRSVHCTCCQCPQRPQQQQQQSEVMPKRPQQQSEEIMPTRSQQSEEVISRPAQSIGPINLQQSKETIRKSGQAPTELNVDDIDDRRDRFSRDDDRNLTGVAKAADKPSKDDRNVIRTRSKEVPLKKSDIPPKAKITLRSSKDQVPRFGTDSSAQPVQYYDHPNRFSKQYIPKSHVEKIDDDSLIVSPNVLSEDEIRDRMRQRDVEAHIRGQVALEKERLQREYRELMKKLPALQKQERIYDIGTDKEKYHMSRDRLEELEKKRQNRLDNAYEELFVRRKPATVTLPRRKEEDAIPSLNLASWDVDFEPDTETSKSRSEQLSHLLTNLKAQKDSLIKEIESTLSKNTLSQLTKSSTDNLKSKSTDYTTTKVKRKRSRDERASSPPTTDANVEGESSNRAKAPVSTTTTVPSPRKKAKLKSKAKILILQNSSTQTTPKPGQSASTSPLFNTPATERSEVEPCTCQKTADDDLCEIVIKIKEDEKPEVIVNPPVAAKSVKVITEEKGGERTVPPETKDSKEESKSAKDDSRRSRKSSLSWRENLSRSASSQGTTSTSYFELPSKPVVPAKKISRVPDSGEASISMNSTVSSSGGKAIDPRLLTYIKKLLNMSRASIDELAVSAASEVSTPSPSIVETPTNNPLLQLLNVMKYFNLNITDLQKQLSYGTEGSSVHVSSSESVALSSSSNTSEGSHSVQFQSCTEVDSNIKPDGKEDESNKKLLQYADVAASCTKKISNLTAMIEKVRAEKKKILQSPPTSSDGEKDISATLYLGLPGTNAEKESTSSTLEQDDLDRNLLTIDYSYAERLKRLTSEEIEIEKKHAESELSDGELLTKLKKLVQESTVPERKEEEPPSSFFLDIPKLPRLEAPSLDKKKKRPPPSKGLKAIGGSLPHELSTILEADSQLSTKLESPQKPTSSKSSSVPDILTEVKQKEVKSHSGTTSSDDVSEMETMETMLISIGMDWAIPTLKKTREALALTSSSSSGSKKDSGEVSLREFLSKISSTSSTPGSTLSDSQGISMIQADNRRTSTPIQDNQLNSESKKDGGPIFLTDSDISSVKEHSQGSKEKFYDLPEESLSKTG